MSNSEPNIWYVAHYAGGPGIGRHSRGWYLARSWQEMGVKATVIAANRHHMLDNYQPKGAQRIDSVDYHFLPTPSYRSNGLTRVLNMFAFTAALRAHQNELVRQHGKPDAIIASSPHPFCFLATHRFARSIGAGSIFEVRDLWPASITEILDVSPRHPMIQLIGAVERFAYAKADAVVSLLPETKEYMISRGLNGGRWHYIPNGIVHDERSERLIGSPIFQQIDSWHASGYRIVCYTGALGVPNDLGRLLDAMAILKRENAPIVALIVGRGELENELAAQCASLGLSDRVRVFSQVPKAVARAVQESVDIGFIALKPSSVFRFGISPNKIFDYMMSSLPVVSAIDAANDIVTQAGCGRSVPHGGAAELAAAIRELAGLSLAERRALGHRGYEYVMTNHDYLLLSRRYLEVILPH